MEHVRGSTTSSGSSSAHSCSAASGSASPGPAPDALNHLQRRIAPPQAHCSGMLFATEHHAAPHRLVHFTCCLQGRGRTGTGLFSMCRLLCCSAACGAAATASEAATAAPGPRPGLQTTSSAAGTLVAKASSAVGCCLPLTILLRLCSVIMPRATEGAWTSRVACTATVLTVHAPPARR